MVGNTAVQIISTGSKIKVINVEEHRRRKTALRDILLVLILGTFLVGICYSIIEQSNQSVLLSREIVSLNTDIEQLEKEKGDLQNQQEETIDYDQLFEDAKTRFGMTFPSNNQVYTYDSSKSNAIRTHE